MTRCSSISALLLVASVGCGPRDPETAQADTLLRAGDTLIWTGQRSRYNEEGGVMIGRPPTGPGDGWTVSVGTQFGVRETEEVYRRLVALDARNAFAEFSCADDEVPHFTFDMVLEGAGEYNDRLVSFGYRPGLETWGRERCMKEGVRYLVARTFAEVDSGPSEHYGYHDPSTGRPLPDEEPGERHARWRPVCHCEQRDDTTEWVDHRPKETTLGADARP